MAKFIVNGPDTGVKEKGKPGAPAPTKAGSQAARGKTGNLIGGGKQPGGKKPPQKL